jgi:hypothetical protein
MEMAVTATRRRLLPGQYANGYISQSKNKQRKSSETNSSQLNISNQAYTDQLKNKYNKSVLPEIKIFLA